MENIEIRDFRKKDFFWLDDAYLNGYAKLCGIYATGVYLSLCRHANKEQKAWPSLDLIAEELDLGSTNTVSKAIKQLEKWNIIKVERSKNKETKRQNPNIYTLLDKSVWKEKPTSRNAFGSKADLISDADPTSFDVKNPTSPNEVEGKHSIEPDTRTRHMSEIDFQTFWQSYPRHDVKAVSKVKFLKLDKSLLPVILQAIETQKKSEQWQKENGQFIPQPLTWINQKRWEDEVKEKAKETPQQQLERHARMLLEACGGDHDLAIARFTTGKYTEGVKYEPNDLMKVLHIIHF